MMELTEDANGLHMTAVIKHGALIPVSRELLADQLDLATPFMDWFRAREEARAEEARNGHIGPIHGPSSQVLWDIRNRERVRRNIQEDLRYLMPNRRPLRFIPAHKETA